MGVNLHLKRKQANSSSNDEKLLNQFKQNKNTLETSSAKTSFKMSGSAQNLVISSQFARRN